MSDYPGEAALVEALTKAREARQISHDMAKALFADNNADPNTVTWLWGHYYGCVAMTRMLDRLLCTELAKRRTESPAVAEDSPCSHADWNYDDRGNHWCRGCGIWHNWPHEDDDPDPEGCKETETLT